MAARGEQRGLKKSTAPGRFRRNISSEKGVQRFHEGKERKKPNKRIRDRDRERS